MWRKALLASAYTIASAVLISSQADEVKQHRLVVAANPSLGVTNKEVDTILDEMGKIIHDKDKNYPWDVECPGVEFTRSGNLIQNKNLATTGTFEALEKSLKDNEPSANVLIVVGIDCGPVKGAAGCSPVGKEPLVVGTYEGFNGQLWDHERGHGVGLIHSAEAPTIDTSAPQDVGMRFMFWQLGYGHDGKTAAECAAFKSASLPSIVTVTVPAPAASPQQGTIPQSQPAVPGSVGEEIAKAAAAVGLTPKALRAIGPPWTDGKVPLTQIKDLNSEDISSVRQMLRGDVNAYSAQGITALSLVGNADDIDIIRIPLERPLPAAGPGSQVDGPRLRQLLRAKLAVPQALGVLGNRTKADRAVLALDQTKLLQNSLRLVGPTQALAMSLDSIKGLAIADTAAAQKSLDETLTQAHAPSAMPREQVLGILRNVPPEQSLAAALPPTTIPALAPEEIDSILALQRRVRSGGVDAIFEN